MRQGSVLGMTQAGYELVGITTHGPDLVVNSVPEGIGTAILDGNGVEVVGDDGAVLLDGGPDAKCSHTTEGISDDLTGEYILVERPGSLAAETGGPVHLREIEVEADAMFDDGNVCAGPSGQYLHVVCTVGTLDFANLGNDGCYRGR